MAFPINGINIRLEGIRRQHHHGNTESPTPTPFNTANHTPQLSAYPSPRESEDVQRPNLALLMERKEHSAHADRVNKYRQLAIYFVMSLILTILNKFVLSNCPYPYMLTALHAASGMLGCHALLRRGYFTLSSITSAEQRTINVFSLLYTANVALSNVSLHFVTIPFHQVVRATTPVFTVLIYRFRYGEGYSRATYLSLLPVVAGVALATYGDYYYTTLGLVTTVGGALLAAIKSVATNRMQTGRLSALEILHRIGQRALLQSIVLALVNGEISDLIRIIYLRRPISLSTSALILLNGVVSFGLNIISFTANHKAGALTMSVAANVKQILTIVLSILFFHLHVGILHAAGMLLTLLGGIWYAAVTFNPDFWAVRRYQGLGGILPTRRF
ncbi:MAG: hypothetical protein M1823_001987 [Watsoniomyces obsoletus]|nr:MAG: hypothetical protein M1823_001987 [Watsoniomyces obsoletus]